MDKKSLIQKIFALGKEKGMQDMEVSYDSGRNLSLKVYKKELDDYSLSESESLSFRGIYNGKMGYSYTEKVDESSIEMLVTEAIGNASIIDSEDNEEIFEGSKEYKEVNNYSDELEKVSETDKINFTKQIEEEAYKLDKRVDAVQLCVYGDGTGESIMCNTKGLSLEEKSNLAYAYISVVVKENEDIKTGFSYVAGRDFAQFDAKKMAKEAVDEAVSMLGAKSVKSGNYPVILKNTASADLLEAMESIFSAEAVQKNLSLLKDKKGEKVASECVTIVDDPYMSDGLASRSFDGEGAACVYKKLIENGVLKTYMYNLKTAKKDGVETTGNGMQSSSISPTNMYIEKGSKSLEELVATIDNGLYITSLDGLHAGLNSVSGDFSLSSSGFVIENGKISRPVEQITVAGNFFNMIKDIEEVGCDLKFGLPGSAYIGSPSLKIKSLAVAGE